MSEWIEKCISECKPLTLGKTIALLRAAKLAEEALREARDDPGWSAGTERKVNAALAAIDALGNMAGRTDLGS